jgi:hypothetical protein
VHIARHLFCLRVFRDFEVIADLEIHPENRGVLE